MEDLDLELGLKHRFIQIHTLRHFEKWNQHDFKGFDAEKHIARKTGARVKKWILFYWTRGTVNSFRRE